MNHPSQLSPEQQAQLYQRQLQQAQMQQNPQLQAQMRQAYMQQQQRMAMAQGQFQQNQHLQPHFQQQRRSSPMGQMMPQGQAHMGHPGQQNAMMGYGGMPPPSSGSMGVTMPQGMHPMQQQAYQQQMMRNNNAQFSVGMNPQMASQSSPHPQGTPSRPPSQMRGTPVSMPGGGTPTNMAQGGNITPTRTSQPTTQSLQNAQQMAQQQKSPTSQTSQNGRSQHPMQSQRIDTILEINNTLLKCCLHLQSDRKSHQPDPAQPPPGPNTNGAQLRPTPSMVFLTRLLQSNIAYLTGNQDGKRPRWPMLMELQNLPPDVRTTEETTEEATKHLRELYARLRSLFPEYSRDIHPMTGMPIQNMRPPNQQALHQARASIGSNAGSPIAAAGP